MQGVAMEPKPPLSSKRAPGLILAHANLGDALSQTDIDFYISRDGGYTWFKALNGTYEYHILDFGGIIMAIPDKHNVEHSKNVMKISYDQGECWVDHQFAQEEKFQYISTISEPSGMQDKFSIVGWGNFTEHGGNIEIYHHNLQNSLRKCDQVDFDTFTAHTDDAAPSAGDGCRMGHTLKYLKRKRGNHCIIGKPFDLKTAPCECRFEDYQCDYGFEKAEGGKCERTDSKKTKLTYDICWCNGMKVDSENCHMTFSIKSHKYRKIPGNTCTDTAAIKSVFTNTTLYCEVKAHEAPTLPDNSKPTTLPNGGRVDEDEIQYKGDTTDLPKVQIIEPADAPASTAETGGGNGLLVFLVILVAVLCCITYYFYYQGNRLPGILGRFSRYQTVGQMHNRLDVEEDEGPISMQERY